MLLLAVHLASGMPARATEIGSLKHCNSSFVRCSIYLYEGTLVSTDNYTKTHATIGDNQYMLRFLPAVTSHIIAIHMIYIRPFAQYLIAKLGLGQKAKEGRGVYVFCDHEEPQIPWDATHLTAAFKKTCLKVFPSGDIIFTTASYRQASCGIQKRHIPGA